MFETATYRVQLHAEFGFDAAADLAVYLRDLGVSHLYTSPCTTARPGSRHGYDVVDPTQPGCELGGAAGFERLSDALGAAQLALLVDIVPNHMAADPLNPWWSDVLAHGRASRYAVLFDIDWNARGAQPLALPLLGERYWRALGDGQLALQVVDGDIRLRCGGMLLPLAPQSLVALWRDAARGDAALTARLADAARAAASGSEAWQALASELARAIADHPGAVAALETGVASLNADARCLDALLQQQHYRPSYWRAAQAELAYRRFFDVDSLIGVRVERPEVFEATHALVLDWLQRGIVHGLRVDHPDGLRDPAGYLRALRHRAGDAFIVVEKILTPGEHLRADWPVQGTTGYDFLARVNGLFVDPAGAAPLDAICRDVTGAAYDFTAIMRAAKREVLRGSLRADTRRVVARLREVSARHPQARDFAAEELEDALVELIAALPIYRTYAEAERPPAEEDRVALDAACAAVRAARPDLDPSLLEFLSALLTLGLGGAAERDVALAVQQLSGPAMAKGVEDTAFYRHHRLVSLNEVGGDPRCFGVSVDEFHAANATAQQAWPRSLLATATHDTKRGEDVRARLNLLSEVPAAWGAALRDWTAHNTGHWGGVAPDRDMELLFYQSLVGAWPIETDRLAAYMEKSAREAKQRTAWTAPQAHYEEALQGFVRGACGDARFMAEVQRFVAPLIAAGRINGLAQTLCKITAPGVPDFYQGCELWDLSLVDPDNRRPVDYALRRRLLAAVRQATPEDVLAHADDGRPKLWLIHRALAARHRLAACFTASGDYTPLYARGARAAHCVAFARAGRVVTIVPRLVLGLAGDWRDTEIDLPFSAWRNALTGDLGSDRRVTLRDVLGRFPVALLEAQ